MTNLNDLFKAAADEKKRLKEEKENSLPVKAIKQLEKSLKENSLFSAAKLTIQEAQPQQKLIEAEDLVAAATAALNNDSFQQPAPQPVDQNLSAITKKLQFLEQAVGKIAATGPGGGEVNLRYLDDIDTSTIGDGLFLSYNSTAKKFQFLNTQKYIDRIVSPNGLFATIIDDTGTTTSGGNIVPGNIADTLGTIAKPWKDIYITQGSLYIGDINPAVDAVSLKNTSGYVVVSRGGLKVTDNTDTFEILQLDNTGKLILKSLQPLLTTTAALSLVGNLSGYQLPTSNLGVMMQATGTQDQPSRIYLDGIGVQSGGLNAYAAYIGRSARGTALSPTQSLTGDIIARFGGNAYATSLGVNSISNVRIDMVTTENQTNTNRGSRLEFWTTDIGSATPTRSVHIDSQGIDLSEAADTNAGVTFKNGSLLKYWPSVTGNANKILRTDGTNFFWAAETVVSGTVIFKGAWSAVTPPPGGNPTVSDATGVAGWEYIVSAAGTQNLGSGNVTYAVGDQIIHDGTKYVRIPAQAAQIQSNWTETNTSLSSYIQNKPTLATVATSGSYLDLSNRPSIPAAQVNSDWNSTSGLSQILNKPTIPVTNSFTHTVTTQASTLTVDFAGSSVIFWQPSATGNRAITLTNFIAGRSVKIFITPKNAANTFTFTGVTNSQCSNGSNVYALGGGGAGQSSMMIEIFSTGTVIGGVWLFASGGV
jgi:hypothetical protein